MGLSKKVLALMMVCMVMLETGESLFTACPRDCYYKCVNFERQQVNRKTLRAMNLAWCSSYCAAFSCVGHTVSLHKAFAPGSAPPLSSTDIEAFIVGEIPKVGTQLSPSPNEMSKKMR